MTIEAEYVLVRPGSFDSEYEEITRPHSGMLPRRILFICSLVMPSDMVLHQGKNDRIVISTGDSEMRN